MIADAERPSPRLHVVYRSTAGDNSKPRPSYYDKTTCLLSTVRAAQECDRMGEIVFLNVRDAPMPAKRLSIMEQFGTVEEIPPLGMGFSYLRCLEIVERRGWPASDLVYLAEDDYLLEPSSFQALLQAADTCLDAHYFALYGAVLGEQPNGTALPDELRIPSSLAEPAPRLVDDVGWRRAVSSNLSTGVRVSALQRDRWMHALAPRAGAWFDHFLSLAVQGERPCTWRQLLLPVFESPRLGRRARISTWRAALTVGALCRRRRPHVLLAATPPLACHLESGHLGASREWDALADATRAWGRENGLLTSPAVP